jgi:hypothetical protein
MFFPMFFNLPAFKSKYKTNPRLTIPFYDR